MSRFLLLGVFGCYLAAGQTTKVDLQNQTRGVDFSAATSTKPAKTGTALPSVCSTGEAYVLTTAVAGSNFYICTAANTWSVQSGQPGQPVPRDRKDPRAQPARSELPGRKVPPGIGVPARRVPRVPRVPPARVQRRCRPDHGAPSANCTAPEHQQFGALQRFHES